LTLDLKKAALKTLFDTYDEVVGRFPTACARECSACCTHNVLATSLEVDTILDFMESRDREELRARMVSGTSGKRFRPVLTTNLLARYCIERREPPEEDYAVQILPCPLREHGGCPIYPVRPFGCRAMWSSERCAGEATMDPLLLSLNSVFAQIVEELDQGGLYGNMIDVFRLFDRGDLRSTYRRGVRSSPESGLPTAVASPGFMIPPAHRGEVASVLNRLWTRQVNGLPFREAVASACIRNECESQN
jgi:hypothetical protein